MPFTAGTRLGKYEILSAIGAGGMGEDYRARDSKLDRKDGIALHSIDSDGAGDGSVRPIEGAGSDWAVEQWSPDGAFSI
jgi:hypothetical protein